MPKILIIRFSSIGDIVLTTPVIRCIKQQVANAEVHLAVKHSYLDVVELNPYIDKIHVLKNDLSHLIEKLKAENYDYIIDLHHNLRSLIIKTRLRKKSFSFNKLNFEKWLMVHFKINKLPPLHIVDRYFETTKTLGVTNDGKGLDYFLPGNLKSDFEDKFVNTVFENIFSEPYVAFVIGANHFTKRLPPSKIISICKQINLKIVLLGGRGDNDRAIEITGATGSKTVNACGKLTLNESALIIKHAAHVISHDTGLMHIAAAFKKNMTSVWGNTIPEFGMTPYFGEAAQGCRSIIIQNENLKCRPCSKIGYNQCPKKHFKCMNEISEESVLNAVKF